MRIEASTHSNGDIRCKVDVLSQGVAYATLRAKDDRGLSLLSGFVIYLKTQAEIDAFTALAAALAAQDSKEGEEV